MINGTVPVIGLVGHRGVGKDTVANMLRQMVPGARALAFADPMKEIAEKVFAFSERQLYGPSFYREAADSRYFRADKKPLTPRHALQRLGDWGRECDPLTWVKMGWRRAQEISPLPPLVIFTDVRFWNEANLLHNKGAILWRIHRPDRRKQPWWRREHVSERQIDHRRMTQWIDRELHNDATLEHLHHVVRVALAPITSTIADDIAAVPWKE